MNIDYLKLINRHELDAFLYDVMPVFIEFSDNIPIQIPLFAKALYEFKHFKFDVNEKCNYNRFSEEYRIMYCSFQINNSRSIAISELSKLKPVGVFNYLFDNFDYSPTLDHFRFYQVFKSNETYSPDWESVISDIKNYNNSNQIFDDDVKREIRYNLLSDENFKNNIELKDGFKKKALVLVNSTTKTIEIDNKLIKYYQKHPVLLIGFKDKCVNKILYKPNEIDKGVYLSDFNKKNNLPADWIK